MVKNITVDNFETEVLNKDVPVFVDFYADWCGPCKSMSPLVEELSGEYEGKVSFGKVNVDDNMALAQKYRVVSIPAMIIFKGGSPVAAVIGACSKAELVAKLEEQL